MQEFDQVVVFKLGNESYGVSIGQVKEIIKVPEISKLPDTPNYVDGIANIRGTVYVIFNLRARFEMERRKTDENTKIILVNGSNIGFIVDEVDEIIRENSENVDAMGNLPDIINKRYVSKIIRGDKGIIIVLSLDRLLNSTDADIVQDAVNTAV